MMVGGREGDVKLKISSFFFFHPKNEIFRSTTVEGRPTVTACYYYGMVEGRGGIEATKGERKIRRGNAIVFWHVTLL